MVHQALHELVEAQVHQVHQVIMVHQALHELVEVQVQLVLQVHLELMG